ncbi:hypothetical protein OC846_001850 [Tilletia horrida]|uniref:N-acetyltransferase domain-containing protein n=1 Tax=Tilletia horrida TaxID=155126 RepID=A0AAN6GT38_9BASI|nr:hypothetical protein OC846_001850 [Tilletia horrida]KAK0568367.1 hypothetical protein OC861_001996 [Tilletia horrida]
MKPVLLTTERILLRPFGPADAPQVYEICQDSEIQKWTTVPSPYTQAHADGFCSQKCPSGWEKGTELTWALTLRSDRAAADSENAKDAHPIVAEKTVLGALTIFQREFVLRSYADESVEGGTIIGGGPSDVKNGLWEVGYWVSPRHRGHGYLSEALQAAIQWVFFESEEDSPLQQDQAVDDVPPPATTEPEGELFRPLPLSRSAVKTLGWRAEVGNHPSLAVVRRLGFVTGQTQHRVVFVEGRQPIDVWTASLTREEFLRSTAPP